MLQSPPSQHRHPWHPHEAGHAHQGSCCLRFQTGLDLPRYRSGRAPDPRQASDHSERSAESLILASTFSVMQSCLARKRVEAWRLMRSGPTIASLWLLALPPHWHRKSEGEDRSDPESLASAICVGKNEQSRIVVVATSLLWA